MRKEIERVELIMADAESNHNKVWYGIKYDDGTAASQYGRVGYSMATTEYPSHSILEKKHREKLVKGYTPLKTIRAQNNSVVTVEKGSLYEVARKQIQCAKPEAEKLIDRLVRSNIHKITSSTQITYNVDSGLFSTPLGIVTPDGIGEARTLLADLQPFIIKGEYSQRQFLQLVNRFLMLVPQNVGMKLNVKNLFPDADSLKKQSDILDSLEASYKAVQYTPVNDKDKTVSEEKVFEVAIDIVDDPKEIKRLENWFYGTNRQTHGYSNVKIRNFYSVRIEDNWKNFNEKLGNIVECWHGSSQGNLLSILKSGLRVAPPSTVAVCGALFSAGHYGALDSSKSLQYTFGRFTGQSGESGWLFVGDFALGNAYYIKTYGGSRPSGYDSIWAKKENTGLRFDEIIVPKDNQVRLKYLLECK